MSSEYHRRSEPAEAHSGGRSGVFERRLIRAVACLRQLTAAPESVTVEQLCASMGVSRRTVFRDVSLLKKAGVPVRFDMNAGHYRLDGAPVKSTDDFGAWPLTREESVALLAAIQPRRIGYEPHVRRDLRRAMLKMVDAVRRQFGEEGGDVLQAARRLRAARRET